MTNLAGHYIRISPGDSAEIRITRSRFHGGRYHVDGLALWGEGREYGPNIGLLDFSAESDDHILEHTAPNGDKDYHVTLDFKEGILLVSERNWFGVYGMNVTFEGTYKRASTAFGLYRVVTWAISRPIRRYE